jgi:hypothetical protein
MLRPGDRLTKRFAFRADGRAGRAHAGSRVRVTVGAVNASGASSETVEQLTL